MRVILLLLVSTLMLSACQSVKNTDAALKKLTFLQGQWENNEDGVIVQEKWYSDNGNMAATSLFILGGDTVFQENIKVFAAEGKVLYKSTMGKYVIEDLKTLPLTRCSKNKAFFGTKTGSNSVYISYTRKKGKMILEMRDVVDGKVIEDKNILTKKQSLHGCPSF